MINCLLVGCGGFLGAVCRYLISLCRLDAFGVFPIKTLFVNVVGAFFIGLVVASVRHAGVSTRLALFLTTGFCGGFTTFSTFSLETSYLLRDGYPFTAVAYIVSSLLLSLAAVFGAESLLR